MRPIWRVIATITPMRRPQCVGRNAADYVLTLTLKSANEARDTMFTISLEEYDREKLFLLDDPDFGCHNFK